MITTSIESILFASAKPMAISALKKVLDISDEVLREAIEDIKRRFNIESSGIHLIEADGKVQFVTNPSQSDILSSLFKQEVSGDLTRPSIETLTIIAYRGPITKPEIEQIRGVNCSLIIRNLLMRGLITEKDDIERLQPVYEVSEDFLRHMGIHEVHEMPEYGHYHDNEKITKMIEELNTMESEKTE